MRRVVLLAFLCLFFICKGTSYAKETNSFVTIVNPQRISTYTKDYLGSFREEWSQIERRDLPATWLVTYDVLTKEDFVNDLKKMSTKQEVGIFLEVTSSFAKEAGTSYNQTSSWHYANSLFLSGYRQNERKKLIDTVFKKFKKEFGYYPKSVGGWWVDSYSLSYMKKAYGITGVLGVSDQYDLDNYQVWGTWWSIPYYPSKNHAALPAQTASNKLDVVTFRWAARDPLNGYKNTSKHTPSLYSLQDHPTIGLPYSYFQNLLEVFAIQQNGNLFGHATVGLEGDLPVNTYHGQFASQMDIIDTLQEEGKITTITMKDFSNWYRKQFPNLSPSHLVSSPDLLEKTSTTAIWYQTPHYRAGITYDSRTQTTKLVDFRSYPTNLQEPNYLSPNKQLNLSINLPYTIDAVIDPASVKTFKLGELTATEHNKLVFEKGTIEFKANKILIHGKEFKAEESFPISPSGITYKDSSLVIPFTLKRRLPFLPSRIPFFIPHSYYISQSEYDALQVLKRQKKGAILTFDKDCLKCTFTGQYKPAAAAGQKSYITKYASMPVEIDLSFLLSKSSKEAANILKDKNIRYIYLTHYEDYSETLPFLPQDLGLKRMYQNANVTIWETTNN